MTTVAGGSIPRDCDTIARSNYYCLMRILQFGLLLMAGFGAQAQAPRKDPDGQKRETLRRINLIKTLKRQQQSPAALMSHLFEAKPQEGIWFLEIKVEEPQSIAPPTGAAAGSALSVVHVKGAGKSQTIVTQFISELERRKDRFPTVTLRSIKAVSGDGEAGMDGREFELDVTWAAPADANPAKEMNGKSELEPAELAREFERSKAYMPFEEAMGTLIQKINRAALEANLQITRLEPQTAGNDRGFYQEKTIRMSLTGSYHDIASFFGKIGLFERIITLRNLSLKRGDTGDGPGGRGLNADFEAVIYLQKPLGTAG
jgi:hypothetical protein